ncbi:hypothetical protein ACHWQZ_G016553 [Mnemiopsis leidyi]
MSSANMSSANMSSTNMSSTNRAIPCLSIGGEEFCNVTLNWTPRVSLVGGIFAMVVPTVFALACVIYHFFDVKQEDGVNVAEETLKSYKINKRLIYLKDHVTKEDYEGLKTNDDNRAIDRGHNRYNKFQINGEETTLPDPLDKGGCSPRESHVSPSRFKTARKYRKTCSGKLTLTRPCGLMVMIWTLTLQPITVIVWGIVDVLADTFYFYQLERGHLLDSTITRNVHVNNGILVFAVLGAIMASYGGYCYFIVLLMNEDKGSLNDRAKVINWTIRAACCKIVFEDAPEMILEYFYVDKYIVEYQPWYLIMKDVITAEVLEKMVAINSYLDPNKRANLEEVNRTQKNINKSQYRMKALVSTLCGLAESALDGLECSVEEKTVVKEFCRRYNEELLSEVHVLDGSAKEVIKSLEMSQMVIRTMRSANTTATIFSTTTQTTSLGSSSRLVIGITCSLGAGAIMAALATIESPLAKIVAVASIVSALAFFLPKFQGGQRTMLPEPTEEFEENSIELFDRYNMADSGARLQELGNVGTMLVSGVTGIQRWVSDTEVVNNTLASVTGRGNQLQNEERLVMDKLVTAAQKLGHLKQTGLDLVVCLGGICTTAIDLLECNVQTDGVITTYTNDLENEVMTTKLPDTLVANREAEDSMVEVKMALDQLIAWCRSQAVGLPEERDRQIRSARQDVGTRTASHVLSNAGNMIVRSAGPRMLAASALISVFTLIAGYVESEHYRVPAIQDSYNCLIDNLNIAVDRWGVMISRVREHQQDLLESQRIWLRLKSDARRSTSIGQYILTTADRGIAQNLERRFREVLDVIVSRCEEFSNAVAIDRLSLSTNITNTPQITR